jgi:hypothetical protein
MNTFIYQSVYNTYDNKMSQKSKQFENKYLGVIVDTETGEYFVAVQIKENEVYLRNITNTGKDFYVDYDMYMKIENDSISKFKRERN